MLENRVVFIVLGLLFVVSCTDKKEPSAGSDSTRSTAVVSEPVLTPEEEAKTLIAQADCMTCHKADDKLIGPSFHQIAAKYTEANTDQLVDKIVSGGSGVWGEVPMAAHPTLDKEKAKKIVKYILTLKK